MLLKHLQPWHSSDDGSDSAVGQNVGFFKTLGLRPRYFQAEARYHSCQSKVMDGEDVRDGACSASWQLHLFKSMSLYPDISLNEISTSKDTEAPSKTTSLCQEITWCARKSYLGLGHLTMAL